MNPVILALIILIALLIVLAVGFVMIRRRHQQNSIEERLGRYESMLDDLMLMPEDKVEKRLNTPLANIAPFPYREKPKEAAKPSLNIPAGGIMPAEENDQSASVFVTAEPTQFSAFFPEAVQPGQSYILMVFAHLESVRNQIIDLALNFQGMMGGKSQSETVKSAVHLLQDETLTFVPEFEGIEFTPQAQTITWKPPHQSANFLFKTPATLDTDMKGRVLIYHGLLIAGEITVTIKQTNRKAAKTPGKKATFKRLDPVFASYSHRDTPIMEYFRQARENLGQKMLVDIYDLRAGDYWQQRLYEMIEESAAFQLFWSEHSAASTHCRDEWLYALKFIEARPRFIQPVWWQTPMPIPPPELEHLHFQKVNIPDMLATDRQKMI